MKNSEIIGADKTAHRVPKINTITQGDCLESLATIPDCFVDMVITDPPYKLSQTYSSNVDADNLLAVSAIWPVAQDLLRVTKPGGICVVFYDVRILPLCLDAMRHCGWKYLRTLTLYRRWGNAHQLHGWMSTSDHVLVFCNPQAKHKFQGKWAHDVYVKDKPEVESTGHPAQKPLSCVEHIVENCSRAGEVVLDPYLGSGTTAIACINTGRNYIGIEKEEKYCKIAEERTSCAKKSAQENKEVFHTSPNSGSTPC